MSVQSVEKLRQYVRRLCDEVAPPEDALLLKQFIATNDREAFELLIARHGPMVLGTARRLVDESHDAEDVFQAVFLSFARLAKTIRQANTLPAWLYKTTCRIAAKARKHRVARLQSLPEPCEKTDPEAGLVWQEIRQALDEELQRLPERLRSPLLLCYLSGLTRDEAAKQLGWSLGTLKRRLEEGRKALRIRLERRGIAAAGLALAVLVPESLQADVSKSLLESSLSLIFSKGTLTPATVSVLVLHSVATLKGLAMKSIFAILAAVGIGVGLYAAMGQADPPKKQDEKTAEAKPAQEEKGVQMDDPLPAGGVLRFGTSRFRYGSSVKCLAVSSDGKLAFATNDLPSVFDLASGRVLYSLNWGGIEVGAFSPDGRTIVVEQDSGLHVFDAITGKPLRTIKGPTANRLSHGLLVFTPDGKAVAVVSHEDREPRAAHIHLIDLESGKAIRDFSADKLSVMEFAFSPDGKLMASGGYDKEEDKENYFARLWDVETGKEIRRFMHGKQGYGIASLKFSPDGKTLATLGTQAGVLLRLFDVDTGKLLKAFPKDDRVRPEHGSVAFSPDGKTVAAATNSIRLYDTTTGEERLRIDRRASDLHFAHDGKTLTAAVIGAIYRWDTATGKSLIPEGADNTASQIHVTADGSRVITCDQYSEAYIWDGTNGKLLRRFQVGWQSNLALSPDGRFLAWLVSDESVKFNDPQDPRSIYYGSRIRLYDIAADKFVDRFPAFKGGDQDLAFTTDGKKLVTADQRMVRTWNFEAGKEERSFPIMTDALKKQSFFPRRTRLSPDGKTAVVSYEEDRGGRLGMRERPHLVRLWDVATGKELPELNGGYPIDRAFSPDGRLVVTRGGNSVCEIATGKQVAALPDDPMLYIRAAAFSRDGHYLATAVPEDLIQIWEVATWTKQREFKGYKDRSITLTFGPGGRLFSGNHDTTVLAWDTRPPHVAATGSLEGPWRDLAKRESAEAFTAEGNFVSAGPDAVKFFADKIKPEESIDAKRVQQLFVDLDSDQFKERDAASKALGALGHQVKPYLLDVIKTTKSREVQDRAKKILEGLRAAAATPQQLRQMRAVLVLELIGDDESKSLLNKWAGGSAAALLTEEASAALARLEGAAKANP